MTEPELRLRVGQLATAAADLARDPCIAPRLGTDCREFATSVALSLTALRQDDEGVALVFGDKEHRLVWPPARRSIEDDPRSRRHVTGHHTADEPGLEPERIEADL